MASTVYIETTVPSAYVSTRTDPSSLHRRQVTREWWRQQLRLYDAWASDNVIIELRRGSWSGQTEALGLVEPLPRLAADPEVLAVANRDIRDRGMPADLAGDAAHMAFASLYEMDILLTWNIRHRRLGLLTPGIVTPEMLWLEDVS
jgi:hypothetical protein